MAATTETQMFTAEEVAQHNTKKDAWIVIDGTVYDVSKFARMHPGGESILLQYAGKDATKAFYQFHRLEILRKYDERLKVGELEGARIPQRPRPSELSKVPFAEPSFEQGFKTPYYKDSHRTYRKNLREFIDREIMPHAAMWEEAGKAPSAELFQKLGKAGVWAARMAPGPQLKLFPSIFGVPTSEFDAFHEMITHEEVCRIACPGLVDGLGSGLVIGLPTLIYFGTEEMRQKVVPQCIMGEKRICLAISEPAAGSDVANIQCTATKTPCGKFYIVNGCKKWITNGTFSDYFVTAVRTGGEGIGGVSLLLIERSEGLETEPIKTSYSPAAGTAYITYENVKVPVSNLLGKENQGFGPIMANFNHERWVICVGTGRVNRLAVEECWKWASQRMVFGKPLISQPVIRMKLAKMVALVESCHNWLENITFQMATMSYKEQARYLAGPIALLKYQTTRASNAITDDAAQIFGGRAISRTGMGQVVERLGRASKFSAILGGSEEIMADLGVRQSMKAFPLDARL